MRERKLFKEIGDSAYDLDVRGFTVVGIAPKGAIYPLFEREHMRRGSAPMKRVERFVPRNAPQW